MQSHCGLNHKTQICLADEREAAASQSLPTQTNRVCILAVASGLFGNDYAKSQNTHLKKVKSAELATSWRLLETIWEKHVGRVTFNFCYL